MNINSDKILEWFNRRNELEVVKLNKDYDIPFSFRCINCNALSIFGSERRFKESFKYNNKIKRCAYCYDDSQKNKQYRSRGFNLNVCKLLEFCNRKQYRFQHAMNFGEYHVSVGGKNYYLDGYDDINKIIFEYDEKGHTRSQRLEDLIKTDDIIFYFKNNLKLDNFYFLRYFESKDKMYRFY